MKTLSILGAGWLGLELAKTVRDRYRIKLSARNEKAQIVYGDLGFESHVLTENAYDALDELLTCSYLFINYPPSKFHDYLRFIKTVSQHPLFTDIEKIFFVSSTSIYPKHSGIYDENTQILSSVNPLYYEVEKSLLGKAHVIFRCAGLMGAGRIAGRYVENKIVKDGKSPLNHVHRSDVIRAFSFVMDHPLEGIFNICAPLHPIKEDLYRYQSEKCHFILPLFNDSKETLHRIIDSQKLERCGFEYLCKNPMDFID